MKWWIVILVICVGCSDNDLEYKNSKTFEADMEVLNFYAGGINRTQNVIKNELLNRGESSDSLFIKSSKIHYSKELDRFERLINQESIDKDVLIGEANKLLNYAALEKLDTTGLKKGLQILSNVVNEDNVLMTATTFLTNARYNYLNDLKVELKEIESDVWRADKVNYWIQEDRNVIARDSMYGAAIFVFNEFGPNGKLIEKFMVNDSVIKEHQLVVLPKSDLQPELSIFSETEIQSVNPDIDPLISRSKLEIKYEDCAE